MSHIDKNQNKIHVDSVIFIDGEHSEYVFKIYNSAVEDEDLGVLATSMKYAAKHRNSYAEEMYNLSQFSHEDIEIVSENPPFRYDEASQFRVPDETKFLDAVQQLLGVELDLSSEDVQILDELTYHKSLKQLQNRGYGQDEALIAQLLTRLYFDYYVITTC